MGQGVSSNPNPNRDDDDLKRLFQNELEDVPKLIMMTLAVIWVGSAIWTIWVAVIG